MKISIITPSFNQGEFIEQNISSVMNQNYSDFEHIIIDGGSTDNTVEILKKYSHLKWVSEPDEGQADALNKGLKIATGDIIGWLNSDDYYLPSIFNQVAKNFEEEKTEWIIGNLKYYYKSVDRIVEIISLPVTFDNLIKDPDIVKQQSTFFRKLFINKIGGWNSKYFMIMDYELWLRASKISNPKMVNSFFAVYVNHPLQKTNPKNFILQAIELVEVLIREKAPIRYVLKLVLKKGSNLLRNFLKSIAIKLNIIDKNYQSIPYSVRKL